MPRSCLNIPVGYKSTPGTRRSMENAAAGHRARPSAPPAVSQQTRAVSAMPSPRDEREARWQAFYSNPTLRAELEHAIRVGIDC